MKRLRWLLVVLPLVVAAWLGPHWAKLETVQLTLAASSKDELLFQRIQQTLEPQLQILVGQYFWNVSLGRVQEIALKDKRVQRVAIYREFPAKIRIEILPHTPVLAYLSSDNRFYPVATDATLLPALPLSDLADLPILRGEELRDEQRLREAALDLFAQIPAEGGLNKKNISEIYYNKKDGFRIFVSDSSSEVKVGDSDFGPKLSKISKVLSYLDSQSIKGRVIDASFAKKVVVRVRKRP